MPTYDYRCIECGHEFEEFQSISAEPLLKCPKCGKDSLKRGAGGGAGMIFKGAGFYLTDYKKKDTKKEEKKAAPPPKEPTTPEEKQVKNAGDSTTEKK